jgi:NADPH:quinone reductase-like Zn-dependent oxidoreductase
MSFAEAATLPLAYWTATTALNLDLGLLLPAAIESSLDQWGLRSQAVLVIGGSAAIGQMAIQLMHHAGFENGITTASTTDPGVLRSLGANVVFGRSASTNELERQILNAAGGKLTYIFDVISSKTIAELANRVIDEDEGKLVLGKCAKAL